MLRIFTNKNAVLQEVDKYLPTLFITLFRFQLDAVKMAEQNVLRGLTFYWSKIQIIFAFFNKKKLLTNWKTNKPVPIYF